METGTWNSGYGVKAAKMSIERRKVIVWNFTA
jgi:hypothetical protein